MEQVTRAEQLGTVPASPADTATDQATQDQQPEAPGGIVSILSRVPPPTLQHHRSGKTGSLRHRSPLDVDEPCQLLILDQHPYRSRPPIAYSH
jgi:hypothetical protein